MKATVIFSKASPQCRASLPVIYRIASKNSIELDLIDISEVKTIEEMSHLHIHGIPLVRYNDREVFGDFSEKDLETLFAEDIKEE